MLGRNSYDSLNQADASALCFSTNQDAVEDARKAVKEWDREFIANRRIGMVEAYVKGRYDIVMGLRSKGRLGNFKLVFFGIPSLGVHQNRSSDLDADVVPINPDWGQSNMLGTVSDLVHCPQRAIPSFVRLEGFEQEPDVVRQILAPSFGIYEHVVFRWPEGKFSGFRRFPDMSKPDLVGHLVERGTQIVGDVEQDARQVAEKFLGDFDFIGFCDSVEVWFDDVGKVSIVRDDVDFGVEITNVVFRADSGDCGQVFRLIADSDSD